MNHHSKQKLFSPSMSMRMPSDPSWISFSLALQTSLNIHSPTGGFSQHASRWSLPFTSISTMKHYQQAWSIAKIPYVIQTKSMKLIMWKQPMVSLSQICPSFWRLIGISLVGVIVIFLLVLTLSWGISMLSLDLIRNLLGFSHVVHLVRIFRQWLILVIFFLFTLRAPLLHGPMVVVLQHTFKCF